MRSAGREPDERIARDNGAAVDRPGFLDHADGKSRKVVFAGHERIGMLGRFAADERAAGLLAPGGDTLDDFAGHRDVEPLADVIIEEE